MITCTDTDKTYRTKIRYYIMTPIFTSLGLFIIDENHYPRSWKRETEYNIIGGGVSYAVIGGRIASGPNLAKGICGIVDKGTDFPPEIEEEINEWGTGIVFRSDSSRLTTRGANIYDEKGIRNFVYRAPKKRIEAHDILITSNLIELKSFHFCCAVDRCEETIDLFTSEAMKGGRPKPLYIFEPFPDVRIPDNFEQLARMLHKVDIFSPNLHEAASFAGLDNDPETEEAIKELASLFLKHCSQTGGVVIRCGHMGSFIMTHDFSIMLPAYHNNQAKVKDVTGGGNSYCGAFVTTLALSGNWLLAGVLANIASGIVVERLGVPKLENELWNGTSVKDRLDFYIANNSHLFKDPVGTKIDWL